MSNADFSDVTQAVKLFAYYSHPWAVCGGWGIDLFLNCVTRPHKDVDFVVLRKDQLIVQEYLLSRGWTLEKAIPGQLFPWQIGEWIDFPVHTIWCKKPKASPDFIELLFNEVDDTDFLFRRNALITLPIEKMIISSASGIPILAPEIVLLYKSADAEDLFAASDFKNVIPTLSAERCDWLAGALRKMYINHVWLENLS